MACFFYMVFTPLSTTSGLWSTGNTRKYHQIDVYIYQCELSAERLQAFLKKKAYTWFRINTEKHFDCANVSLNT